MKLNLLKNICADRAQCKTLNVKESDSQGTLSYKYPFGIPIVERVEHKGSARVAHPLLKYAAVLMMLCTVGIGSAWGAEETITFSTYTTTGSEATYAITWTGNASCTIKQEKGISSNNVSSNYTTAPRWYQNNNITFTPKTGMTITKVVITGYSEQYSGQTFTGDGTITNTSTTVTTITGTWTSAFTIKPGKQCRFGSIVVTYTTSGGSSGGDDKVCDELDRTFTGVTGTAYTAWSDKSGSSSDAVYAGTSAGGNSSIQLRTTNSNEGIVTTTSGGKATSVTVTWNSNTADGRSIDIYGKNTAYTSAANLYNTSTQGTKIGSIAKGSTSLSINDDYSYIGIRSNSEALYLTDVTICWEDGGSSGTGYTVTYDKNNANASGTMTDSNSPYASESTVTVLDNAFTAPAGYVFDHWNTAADDSGTTYNPDDTFEISANTTLYAQWTCTRQLTVNFASAAHGTFIVHNGNSNSAPSISSGTTLENCSQVQLHIEFIPDPGYEGHCTSTPVASAYDGTNFMYSNEFAYNTVTLAVTFTKACSDPTITFPTTAITKYMGDGKFTFEPTITGNDLEAELTYSSNNTDKATVNETTGEVTILDATGADTPVTITATLATATDGDDCQNSVSASYTLTIYNRVTWLVNGEETNAGSPTTFTTEGGKVTAIPTAPDGNNVCSGKTFVGWTTSEYSGDEAPSPLYLSLSNFSDVYITDNTSFYAVFAESSGGGGGGSSDYVLVESDLGTDWAGDYLIAYSSTVFADGRIGGTGTGGMGANGTSVNPAANLDGKVVAASWGDTYHVTLEEISEGNNTYLLKTQDNSYNYQTSNNNGLASSTNRSTASNYPITITYNSSDDIALSISSGVIFHYNALDYGYFRFYKNGGQNAVYLYKKGGGSGGSYSDYSTTCGNCLPAPAVYVDAKTDHAILSWPVVEGATGYTVTCSDGSVSVSGTTATITGLTSETEYTYTIQSIGPNPPYDCFPVKNGSFTTPGATIDIVEWQEDAVVIYVDKEESINPLVIIDGEVEHGSISGTIATDLFFSKYFEGAGSMKLVAIFNGTGKEISLKNYKIVDKHVNSSGAYSTPVEWPLTTLGRIKAGQEIIFFTRPQTDGAEEQLNACSTSFLNSVAGKSGENDNPRWIECDNAPFSKMQFNGNDAMILQKSDEDIDIIGSYALSSLSSNCWGESSWGGTIKNMDYGKTAGDYPNITLSGSETMLDYGIDLTNETISAYTARCILFRNATVTSGEKAVALNGTDFVTLSAHNYLGESYESEWYGRSVCVSQTRCDELGWNFVATSDGKTYRDNSAATCNSYKDLGEFDYNSYYTEYDNISDDTHLNDYDYNPATGEYTIPIDNLSQYSCLNLRFQLKQSETVLAENAVQVPIIVSGAKATNDAIFNEIVEDKETHVVQYDKSIERCQTCNVVVLGSGTLTKAVDGATNDVAQVKDLTIYPGGKLVVPSGTNYTVHSLALRRQEDEVSLADIKGNLSVGTTNGVYFDLRINPTNWHYITLPYDCNVDDIEFSNGETATLGKDFSIAWYDGAYRAANKDGGWTDVTAGTILRKGLGYIVSLPGTGAVKRELRFPLANGVIADEKTNKTVGYVYGYGNNQSDEDLTPNHKGWNLIGNPYMMYYATDITTPLATGELEYDDVTGQWNIKEGTSALRYLVEPINNGWSGYRQIPIGTHMPPFTSYFVQIGGENPATAQSVSFNLASAGKSSIIRRAQTENVEDNHLVWYSVMLTAPNGEKDNTTLLISDQFTDQYDMMDDLVKQRGSYYKYYNLPILASRNEKEELAFNALPDRSASVVGVPLNYYAAEAGTYTIHTDGQYALDEVQSAVLYDATTGQYNDLLTSDYTFVTTKGDNTDRFRLFVTVDRKQSPEVATNRDNRLADGQLNLTVSDRTLILTGLNQAATIYVYDMNGKLICSEKTNGEKGVWRTTAYSSGVYFVRVDGIEQQTLRAIVK